MRNRVLWVVISLLLFFSLVLVVCSEDTASTSTQQPATSASSAEPTTTVTQTNWWNSLGTPDYGGTIKVRTDQLNNVSFDPANPGGLNSCYIYERLFNVDWKMDRNKYAFTTDWIPAQYWAGQLAESWEQTDPLTVTVRLKEGIYWQNKAPVNGREFVADDVQQHYDRLLGNGSGYTLPDPLLIGMIGNIEKVNAKDKYTVQFELKQASAFAIYQVFGSGMGDEAIESPEWAKQYGMSFVGVEAPKPPPPGAKKGPPPPPPPAEKGEGSNDTSDDWKTAVSTGPWIVSEFIRGTSLTFERNPDYWGYDERYPDNKLPYIDSYKEIAIPDTATALAALRTGKIDMIADPRSAPSWQQAENLAKTNPEIEQTWWPSPGYGMVMRCDNSPFTDIRVRKALNMAIDRKTIAKSQFGSGVDGLPSGPVSPLYTGWVTPYEQWPADLQQEYSFNPDQAKQLLADAGYPDGFKTNVVASTTDDVSILQIIKSEFMDIGVDMEIKPLDATVAGNYMRSGKFDQMAYGDPTGALTNPWDTLTNITSDSAASLRLFVSDAKFDELIAQLKAAEKESDIIKYINEADMYIVQQHWGIYTFPITKPAVLCQTRVRGYSGDMIKGGAAWGFYGARFWVDDGK